MASCRIRAGRPTYTVLMIHVVEVEVGSSISISMSVDVAKGVMVTIGIHVAVAEGVTVMVTTGRMYVAVAKEGGGDDDTMG